MAPEVRKSVPELAFVKFGFLDLADFAVVDRFLILPPPPALSPAPPPAPALADAS